MNTSASRVEPADLAERVWREHRDAVLAGARSAADRGGVLVLADPTGTVARRLVSGLAKELGDATGRPPAAWVEPRDPRPWQPLAGLVEGLIRSWSGDGEDRRRALARYAPVVSSLKDLEETGGGEEARRPAFHAGVVDYLLGRSATGLRDFFRGRDVSAWVGEDLLRLLSLLVRELRPPLLWLGGLEAASDTVCRTLEWLPALPARGSSLLVLSLRGSVLELPAPLARAVETARWPVVELATSSHSAPDDAGPGTPDPPPPTFDEAMAAMARAWHVSDYGAALEHGRRAMVDPEAVERVQPELVLALLCAEAGRAEEADGHFSRLLARASRETSQVLIRRLQGYAQIFGLEDFERGLETFEMPRAWAEREGRARELAFLDNTSAWALLRLGRFDEAYEVESRALASVLTFDPPDTYLETLIHLNLGRLLRTRDPLAASRHVAAAMAANEGDMGPDLLLIFLVLAAETAGARGDEAARRSWWTMARDVARDFELAEVSSRLEPVLRPWLAEVSERFGDAPLPGDRTRRALELGAAAAGVGVSLEARAIDNETPTGLSEAVAERREVLELEALDTPMAFVASRLRAGEPVILLSRLESAPEVVLGRVLWDPASAGAWRSVRRELRRSRSAGWMVTLADAAAGLVVQEAAPIGEVVRADLAPEARSSFPGLLPFDLRTLRLGPRPAGPADAELYQVLARYAEGGAGLLSVGVFRVAGCSPPRSMAAALDLFLASGFETLVAGGWRVRKRRGAEADANLLRLRPKLAGACRVHLDDEPPA
ncbi:MAG: tetratricopeptide repeat protein, partial [Acidobacteria bacterium]|nr:tetratricopeptide repeat protein [Acidobacteriota bacterium]